jgi:pimeloyl-ACP methyl ester carboxylesterase
MSAVSVPLHASPRLVERAAALTSAVFAVAMGLVLVHLVDDAFVDAPAGTSVGSNLATIAVPAALTVALALGAKRLRPGLRAWLALVAGSVAVADGGLHLAHAQKAGGLSGSDLTGLLSGFGGVALLIAGVALVVRPKAPRGWKRRWSIRFGAALGTAATAVFVIMPIAVGVYFVHKQPVHIATTAWSVPHRDVTLHTSDGLDLAGWYAPAKNGATIILVHGSGGSRTGGIESRATMFARHGFGVLLYDARGGGDSEGRPEAVGWTWHRDVEAAVDFLRARGVTNIGAFGLSTGAEAVLDTAGRDPRIKAVGAEGAEARTVTEIRLLPHTAGNLITGFYTAGMFTVHHVLSHAASPPSLKKQVAKIAPRPIFLISSGDTYERDLNRAYYRAATCPKTLWEIADASHTGGLSAHPREYDRRVTSFFARALHAR